MNHHSTNCRSQDSSIPTKHGVYQAPSLCILTMTKPIPIIETRYYAPHLLDRVGNVVAGYKVCHTREEAMKLLQEIERSEAFLALQLTYNRTYGKGGPYTLIIAEAAE